MIALEYARSSSEPAALVLRAGDPRYTERIVVANGDRAALFKIQTTASKALRVRPALAHLPPRARVDVRIHLSPQEQVPSACKFLVLVREDSEADHANSSDAAAELDLKQRWKRAEQRSPDSLLFSETISVHIMDAVASPPLPINVRVPRSHAESASSTSELHFQPAQMMRRAEGPTLAGAGSSLSTRERFEPTESLHAEEPRLGGAGDAKEPITMSTEHLARLIVLLMKDQSTHAANRLTDAEAAALKQIRAASTAEQWTRWCTYALRMRVLVREQQRRQQSRLS